jgi:hypothetical protein
MLRPRDKVTDKDSTPHAPRPTPHAPRSTPFDPGLLVAVLLALFAIVPLLAHPGLPNTADGPAHLMRQAELNQAWQDGTLYPRWAPDLAYGYGMPLFNYAPPLLYQVTQILHLTGLPLDAAMKGTIILMLVLYSLGMYLFVRDLFGPRAGLLAAAVYLYAPYRLREAYIQGNYGQFCGLAFYPLILWSFHGLVTTNRRRYLPLAALSLTGLLLSHNISAMLFAPLLGVYLVFLLGLRGGGSRGIGGSGTQGLRDQGIRESGDRGMEDSGTQGIGDSGNREARSPDFPSPDSLSPDSPIPDSLSPDSLSPARPLPRTLAAILLGLGLSAFFWLPAFGERDLIRLSGITRDFFDFRLNFISLAELLALPRPLDLSAINPYYPLSLGLAQITFAVLAMMELGLYFVLRNARRVRIAKYPQGAYRTSTIANGRSAEGNAHGARSHAPGHVLFFATALLVTAFLSLPYSQPIWEAVPLLELAEFPWRWLGPAILCAAVLAGAALYLFERLGAGRCPSRLPGPLAQSRTGRRAGRGGLRARGCPSRLRTPFGALRRAGWGGVGVGLAFTLAANLFYLFPVQFIPWGTPTPADAVAYEAQSGAIGTTSTGEFLPHWADQYPSPDTLGPDYAAGRLPTKLDPASLPQGATATTLSYTARETRIAVSSPAPFIATFRALYWPGWRVTIQRPPDTREGVSPRHVVQDLEITRPDGLMQTYLPAGEYEVSLQLFPTPIRRAGTLISALSLAGFLGLGLSWLVGWKSGRVEGWKGGRVEGWKGGRLGAKRPTTLPLFHSSTLPPFQAVVISAALIAGLLVTRPLAGWFRVQSPPDHVYGAQYALRADFGDQVRLLAYDLPTREGWKDGRVEGWKDGTVRRSQSTNLPTFQSPNLPMIQAETSASLPVVLYWRALAPLATDYHVFVHLDAPDGQTYASADERHPADIPTSHWPPSLYLRNPLSIALPSDLPSIRYTLTAGLYDPQTGARLPVTSCDSCPPTGTTRDTLPLAYVWLLPTRPLDEEDISNRLDYHFGDQITLLGYALSGTEPVTLTLYWRAEAQVENNYTVFIHVLGTDGEIIDQFDAPPLNGLYPSDAWLPGQTIADVHSITLPEAAQTLAVGLYDPTSLTRLPVTDRNGQPTPDNAIRLQVANGR